MEQTMCPPSPALCQPAPVRGAAPPAHRATGHRSARGGLRLAPGCQRLALDVSFPQNFDFFFFKPSSFCPRRCCQLFQEQTCTRPGTSWCGGGVQEGRQELRGEGAEAKALPFAQVSFLCSWEPSLLILSGLGARSVSSGISSESFYHYS